MNLKTKLCTITSTLLLIGLLGACSSTDKTKTAETSTTESTNATHTVTDTLGHKVAIPQSTETNHR